MSCNNHNKTIILTYYCKHCCHEYSKFWPMVSVMKWLNVISNCTYKFSMREIETEKKRVTRAHIKALVSVSIVCAIIWICVRYDSTNRPIYITYVCVCMCKSATQHYSYDMWQLKRVQAFSFSICLYLCILLFVLTKQEARMNEPLIYTRKMSREMKWICIVWHVQTYIIFITILLLLLV